MTISVTNHAANRGFSRYIYTPYAWLSFLLCLTGAFISAAVLPGLARRRRWVSAFARAFFLLAGIRTRIRGAEHLPEGHCVVVANHSSYLDGVILQAFLPPRFSYVIKSEMQKVPLGGFMLRRIGSRFVDRFVAAASARDARNLLRAASNGEALGFFPEGTFSAEPGLGRFRSGAFMTARRSGVPLVPVVIQGSRHILPAGTLLAAPGTLTIVILAPILPDSEDFSHHRDLARAARQRMLRVLPEPDLATRDVANPDVINPDMINKGQ